jgi:hypothetical protein
MATILRPLSLSELLDGTFSLYRKNFALFVGIVALPNLAWLIVQLTAVVNPLRASAASVMLLAILGGLLYFLAIAAAQAATVVAVSAVYLERPISVRAAYAAVGKRVFRVVLIMIAVGICAGFGLLLLIVPGIIWYLMWSLAVPVAIIEDKGLNAATARSRQLTRGSRGRIFVITVVLGVLVYAVMLLLVVPLGIAVAVFARGNALMIMRAMQLMNPIASFLSQCLIGPLFMIALSLVYYDLRVRKEAFDLELMTSALEGAASANPAGAGSAQ